MTAMLWMVATGLAFVTVTAIVKHLGGRVPAAQAAFLRYALGLVFVIPVLPALRQLQLSRSVAMSFGLRGVVHTVGVALWFFAMARIAIAEVTAMNYLTPVLVTLGAALFLGERFAVRRLLAVLMALVGAIIILRPGFRDLDPGHFAMLGTAVCFASSFLLAKRLAGVAAAPVVVALLSITVTIGLAPLAALVWVPVALTDLAWLFLTAAFATFGHYAMTRAFAAGPMAVTQPVTFLQLIWAVLLGLLVFGEPLDGWVILGGAVIFVSVSYIAWREAQLGLQRRAAG